MPRIRSVKPDLWLDEELAECGFAARYFFIGLFTQADREGRLEYRPQKLQAVLLPWDNDVDAATLIDELSPHFVIKYSVNGREYLEIRHFTRHQRPHHTEIKSVIPRRKTKDGYLTVLPLIKKVGKEAVIMEAEKEKEKEVDVAGKPAEEIAPSLKPKELTPIQKVIRGFKEAKGIDSDNKDWDKKFFSRHTRPAKDLLVAFNGDPMAAIAYILTKGEEWEHLPDWGLEAIVKAAAREYNRIGGADGLEPKPVDADSLRGSRSTRGYTQSGALVGDTLRAIESAAVRSEEPCDMGSANDDCGRDED